MYSSQAVGWAWKQVNFWCLLKHRATADEKVWADGETH